MLSLVQCFINAACCMFSAFVKAACMVKLVPDRPVCLTQSEEAGKLKEQSNQATMVAARTLSELGKVRHLMGESTAHTIKSSQPTSKLLLNSSPVASLPELCSRCFDSTLVS